MPHCQIQSELACGARPAALGANADGALGWKWLFSRIRGSSPFIWCSQACCSLSKTCCTTIYRPPTQTRTQVGNTLGGPRRKKSNDGGPQWTHFLVVAGCNVMSGAAPYAGSPLAVVHNVRHEPGKGIHINGGPPAGRQRATGQSRGWDAASALPKSSEYSALKSAPGKPVAFSSALTGKR